MLLLNAIFAWVVAASLRASLLATAVFAMQYVVGRRLSARCRHALWLPVILVAVMPMLPASPWSMENGLAKLSAALPSATFRRLHLGFPADFTDPSAVSSALCKCPWIPAGWMLVTCALLAVAGIGYQRTLALIARDSSSVRPELLRDIVAEARRIHLRRLPRVMVSAAVESPAVTGLLRPVLLLPGNFPAGLTRTEARLVLLHELAHLKRHDLLLNWCLCVLQALHWFNPMLWLALGRLRADREAVCDARVLSAHRNDLRAEYAQALLKLHQRALVPGLSLAFGGTLSAATLRGRLLSVTRHRRVHPAWNVAGAVMVAGLLVAGATRPPTGQTDAPDAGAKQSGGQDEGRHLTQVLVDLPPLAEKAGEDAPPDEQPRHLFETDRIIKETLGERFHGNALPEWWPMINSARILFQPVQPAKRPISQRSIRRFV